LAGTSSEPGPAPWFAATIIAMMAIEVSTLRFSPLLPSGWPGTGGQTQKQK
jgi:hypothetical protein